MARAAAVQLPHPANTKWYTRMSRSTSSTCTVEGAAPGGWVHAVRHCPEAPERSAVRIGVLYPVSKCPARKIAAYMQQQYKQLGIEVEVKGLDANAYFEEAKRRTLTARWVLGRRQHRPRPLLKGPTPDTGQQNTTGFASDKGDQLTSRFSGA